MAQMTTMLHFRICFFLTGHIVSIDEETNTFRLRVIVEDDSERTLEVHFGENLRAVFW